LIKKQMNNFHSESLQGLRSVFAEREGYGDLRMK